MPIMRIESLIYGVENLEICIKFLDDWGLEKIEETKLGAEFRTPDNQSIILRPSIDNSLPPTEEKGSTLREILWGVDSKTALNDLANDLETDRNVSSDNSGVIHTTDDSQNCIGFKISNPKVVDVSLSEVNSYEDQTFFASLILCVLLYQL